MSKSIYALMLLIVFALASIVPWADAQQKPSNVLIWCQNTNGTSSPCVAGNSLDYDSGGGTLNQGTVGIALPASGGPVAGGTSTNPIRVDPTGTTTQPVSGTVTANAGTNLNTSSLLTTTAHDAAFGTAGTADTQVRTIQGIASMVPLAVSQSGTWNIGSVTTLPALPANQSVNVAQINGVTPLMGNGVTGTGSPRVTIASDNTAFSVNALQSGTWTVQPGNTANTTPWLIDARGNVAHGSADSGNPVKIGCQARTTNRTAEVDADRVDCVSDKNGQLVVTPVAPRSLVGRSGVVTVSTTTETMLIAAGAAGVFRDLTYLKCTNGSATLTRVDLRDATAGTIIDSWWLAANGGGFNIQFGVPYPQATAANNWTIQLSTAVTDVRCAAEYVEKN